MSQGYNKDGLSRREIISLLRMVLCAEDDSSRGGRGYDGADAELYGHKVRCCGGVPYVRVCESCSTGCISGLCVASR